MSWKNQADKEFIITTGDGKEYRPLWKAPSKSQEFNIAEFEFPEVSGTLVKRGQPKGKRYTLIFFFQGDDHLLDSKAFDRSANDNRAWVISHPYYGRITVQPASIAVDNAKDNISAYTVEAIETITEENPKFVLNPPDQIESLKADLDIGIKNSIELDIQPISEDVNSLNSANTALYNKGKLNVLSDINAEEYFNLYNTATGKINSLTSDVFSAINAVQDVINYPALFVQSIKSRISTLIEQFDTLKDSLGLGPSSSRNTKKLYEATGSTLISAFALASITDAEYSSRTEVVNTVEDIIEKYNQFVNDLDDVQSDDNGDEESFIPDAEIAIALNNLINYTISNLFVVAIDSRQERKITLEDDSNVVLLTHRFFGLKPDDSTIDEFININEIGLNEYLQVKKGRALTYYV